MKFSTIMKYKDNQQQQLLMVGWQQEQQQGVIKVKMSIEESPKEIREYKDFTTLTSIRKATQEAIAPTVKSLELQISNVMEDQKEVNRNMSKLLDIFKAQALIEQRIDETNRVVREFKDDQALKRKDDERRASRLDTVNQKLLLEMHCLKTSLDHQDQTIKQINNRTNKTYEMYTAVSSGSQKAIKDIQYKYSEFSKQVLDLTKTIKQEYHSFQREVDSLRQVFKIQVESVEEKTKPLQLYLDERQSINNKFQELFAKIINAVTKEDFEAYRKSQKLFISEHINQIKKDVNDVLPDALRKQLPQIQKKLKEVEKIKIIEKSCNDLEIGVEKMIKKLSESSNSILEQITVIDNELREQNKVLRQELDEKVKELNIKQVALIAQFEQKIQETKLQIQESVSQMVQRETSELQRTIEAEVASNKSISRAHFQNRSAHLEEERKNEIAEIKAIKEKIVSRYDKIEEIGRSIDNKIIDYSTKISRIKSDYELFAENMRKQVSGVIKFRDTFLDRLKQVGKLLSSYTEALFILLSVAIQERQREGQTKKSASEKDHIVFITDYDGIVYERKPQIKKGYIQYRRQTMQTKQFLRSFMYSLITFSDEQCSNLDFLDWKQSKPSQFFKQWVFPNYCISSKRRADFMCEDSGQFLTGDVRHQNTNRPTAQETDQIAERALASTMKQFSKTIDSRAKLEQGLEEGSNLLRSEQSKRAYSIKRGKPNSSKPKARQKSSNDLSRYDQMFLTSRSACRSRISQLI